MPSDKIDITVLSGVSTGDVFHFDAQSLTVGRASENDLVLQDPSVSRKHARIARENGRVMLIDLGSSHGTVHMGFPLKPGEENARQLHDGDEFKVGDAIFRVNFNEPKRVEEVKPDEKIPGKKRSFNYKQLLRDRKKRNIAVAVVLGLVLLLMLLPSGGDSAPRQLSNAIMSIPQAGVIGYYKAGSEKKEKDYSHLDKAQFSLPASDALIEFDYLGDAPIDIYIDEILIKHLEPTPGLWEHGALITRDPLVGYERKLIFDNTGYPADKGKPAGEVAGWAIRNIRVAPLTNKSSVRDVMGDLDSTKAIAEKIDKTADGLFTLVRVVQRDVVDLAHEGAVDAVFVPILIESSPPDGREVKQVMDSIINERRASGGAPPADMQTRHLAVMVELTGKLDAELWRRVDARMNRAELASKVKNYIEAHDQLLSVTTMFPDETDYRYIQGSRMFNDNKIVPKYIKQSPGKYRRLQAMSGG